MLVCEPVLTEVVYSGTESKRQYIGLRLQPCRLKKTFLWPRRLSSVEDYDENLPERLVSELRQLGHDVDTLRAEHLAGETDEQVWQAAQSANRFLITQDLDFSDMRLY